jgi:hypothetical protein
MARTAVVAGTATATVKAVGGAMGGSQQKAAAQQQAAMQEQQVAELQANQEALAQQQATLAQQQAATQLASDSLDGQLVQIQKLAAMKDQGLITEEEFQAKKRQILGL